MRVEVVVLLIFNLMAVVFGAGILYWRVHVLEELVRHLTKNEVQHLQDRLDEINLRIKGLETEKRERTHG